MPTPEPATSSTHADPAAADGSGHGERANGGPPGFDDTSSISIVHLIRFLRRQALLIVALAILGAVVTAAIVAFLLPDRFEASTTLVVVPVTFQSALKPTILPVQGYQRLLESDAVIGETVRHLVAAGDLAKDRHLRLGRDMASRIFVSRRAEEHALAPIIEVVGYGRTAEQAAAIANAWAEVFLERAWLLLSTSLSPTLDLIEREYLLQQKNLAALEQRRTAVADDYAERIDRLALASDHQRIAAEKNTEDLLASFQQETRQVMVAALREASRPEGSATTGAPEPAVEQTLSEMAALRTQLAQTPRFIILEKAITDETLWQAFALHQAQDLSLQSILGRTLLSQEINTVYDELTLRLSQLETGLQTLSSAQRQRVQQVSTKLEALQLQRAAQLAKLIAGRALIASDLERKAARDEAALRRAQADELNGLDRNIQYQQALFSKLASNYNEVVLARAEQSGRDILLAAPAIAPGKQEKRLLLKALVGAFLGGLFGLLAGVVREVGSH
jgi:capsular polysaccharide biosynthesis protein